MFRCARRLAIHLTRAEAFQVLGLSEGAPAHLVKEAYFRLSRRYHPDRNTRNDEATDEHQKRLNLAYNLLRGARSEADSEDYTEDSPRPPPRGFYERFRRWTRSGRADYEDHSGAGFSRHTGSQGAAASPGVFFGLGLVALLFYALQQDLWAKRAPPATAQSNFASKVMENRDLQQAFLKGLWTQREKEAYDKWMAEWIEENRIQERALRIERSLHKDGAIHFKAKMQ
eukprot:EG_transcript_21767